MSTQPPFVLYETNRLYDKCFIRFYKTSLVKTGALALLMAIWAGGIGAKHSDFIFHAIKLQFFHRLRHGWFINMALDIHVKLRTLAHTWAQIGLELCQIDAICCKSTSALYSAAGTLRS